MSESEASRSRGGEVSIVLPAYNAEGVVGESVGRLREELELAGLDSSGLEIPDLEIIVVDDGSSDGTSSEAKSAEADKVITFSRNRGKGAAVRAGVLAATGDVVVFCDVDLSYGPDLIQRFVYEIRGGALACFGQRSSDSGTRVRNVISRLFRQMSALLLRWASRNLLRGKYDTQCGIKAFDAKLAKQIFSQTRINRFAFDIEVYSLMIAWGVEFKSLDVVAEERSVSSVRAVRDGFRAFWDTIRIAYLARRGKYESPESW